MLCILQIRRYYSSVSHIPFLPDYNWPWFDISVEGPVRVCTSIHGSNSTKSNTEGRCDTQRPGGGEEVDIHDDDDVDMGQTMMMMTMKVGMASVIVFSKYTISASCIFNG